MSDWAAVKAVLVCWWFVACYAGGCALVFAERPLAGLALMAAAVPAWWSIVERWALDRA